jgi:hypothetical protein
MERPPLSPVVCVRHPHQLLAVAWLLWRPDVPQQANADTLHAWLRRQGWSAAAAATHTRALTLLLSSLMPGCIDETPFM